MSSIRSKVRPARVHINSQNKAELQRLAKMMKRPMSRVIMLLIEHWNDCPMIRDSEIDDGGIVADSLLAPAFRSET
jgi:hypothetical protein